MILQIENIKEIKGIRTVLIESWNNFIELLPAILIAAIIFIIGMFLIKQIGRAAQSIIATRAKDPLVIDFLVNIINMILTILLVVICLSILGLGSITDKILAGAGITTFLVGFALKDIGENFLAGIIMAFRRPFRIGDLIEVNGVKGKVQRMSLRETSIKTLDGIDIFIPNGIIIKNALENYTNDPYQREEFTIGISYNDNPQEIIETIENLLKEFEDVQANPASQVIVTEFTANFIHLRILYWIRTNQMKVTALRLKSNIMVKTFETFKEKGYSIPNNSIQTIKIQQDNEGISDKDIVSK